MGSMSRNAFVFTSHMILDRRELLSMRVGLLVFWKLSHKCTSVACVRLSFFDSIPRWHSYIQRRIWLDMRLMYGTDHKKGMSKCHSAWIASSSS